MDIRSNFVLFTAMELKVIQTNDDGTFGGPFVNDFEYTYKGVTYRVKIEQILKRELLIGTDEKVECIELFDMESFLEILLFLFDGRFYPIENAAMIDENEDPSIYQNKVNHYYNNRPPIYKSIDICRHQFMKLVNFKDIDLTNTLLEWARISNELDIAFNMLLYCLSDIHMPVDCKISSIIEMVKPFGEIVENNNRSFHIERNKRTKRMDLRIALETVIQTFGSEIFYKELNGNFQEFLDLLVNTRNKISHVKSLQDKACLDGVQCVFYIAKLSIMYRKIIFMMIGIDDTMYTDNIIKAVETLNNWYYEKE